MPIYADGVFKTAVDNGTHKPNSQTQNPSAFNNTGTALVGTASSSIPITLTTTDAIDVTRYDRIKIVANGTEYSCDISSESGLRYLYTFISGVSNPYLQVGLTTSKDDFQVNRTSAYANAGNYTAGTIVQISSIILE